MWSFPILAFSKFCKLYRLNKINGLFLNSGYIYVDKICDIKIENKIPFPRVNSQTILWNKIILGSLCKYIFCARQMIIFLKQCVNFSSFKSRRIKCKFCGILTKYDLWKKMAFRYILWISNLSYTSLNIYANLRIPKNI